MNKINDRIHLHKKQLHAIRYDRTCHVPDKQITLLSQNINFQHKQSGTPGRRGVYLRPTEPSIN